MVHDAALLGDAADERLRSDGRPVGDFRAELRKIPSFQNAISVVTCWIQIIAVVIVAVSLNHPLVWITAFLLMGRAHAQIAALMHEAAHRMLFRNRLLNDFVGRWILGFPSFTPIDSYRRGHMAHHRDEFGPNEPDILLYRGYPISRSSLRRKLIRDVTGQTGWKLNKGLFRATRSTDASTRFQAISIIACQIALIVVCLALGHPWLWLLLWFAPFLTVWRVINRLRAIAEHGGMIKSEDRRNATHTVQQHLLSRFMLVPYWIGWHLAHHVDSGIPMRHLPKYHRALVESGYVTEAIEYKNYLALWKKLSSRETEAVVS